MTAAHLVLVWQERDDPNLLRHAGRAKEVGRNPRVVTYEPGFGPERVVLRVGGRRPARARHSRQDVIERHFGESAPLSLGVEEEVMILDAETLEPVARVDVLVRGAERLDLPGTLKTELHASVVELTTDVCADVDEAIAALRELRAAATRIARDERARDRGRRRASDRAARRRCRSCRRRATSRWSSASAYVARRQGVNGLHVHVGVESADRCWERLEAVLPWLPVVLALSANSPFVDGAATGMLSNRAAHPRRAAARRRAARLRRLRRLGGVGRAARSARRHAGLHARLVGRASASAASARSRCASPTSRPRSSATALIVALVRDLVANAPPSSAPSRPTICRTAGRRRARPRRDVAASGRRTASSPRASSRASCSASEPPEPEAHAQLAAEHVAADLVARTVG